MAIIYKYIIFAILLYKASAAVVDTYYPKFHAAPPGGWMNDPNGLSFYKNLYHLFYQYNPESSQEPGTAHWGHVTSPDLMHWEHQPIAMYPDEWYDKDGVFSGSAIVKDNILHLIYTGNVKYPNEFPDYQEYQALAYSNDGTNFTKTGNNPILNATEHQPNIRDPKVWKHEDTYYMVLGNSFNNNTLGRVLLYSSKNLVSWQEESIIAESDGFLGYMWECPDLFEMNGKFVLLFSPQGVKPEGDKYKNLYQTGYIVGNFDYKTNRFDPITEFQELDNGHDFYATQTLLDSDNRRILIAWFDMWEQVYPERDHGWTGQMTLPRELSLTRGNKLIQKPIKEVESARGNLLYRGILRFGSDTVKLTERTAHITIKALAISDLKLYIESEDESVNVAISYNRRQGTITLDRGGEDGVRRTTWRPLLNLVWNIYVDSSSIELFCGDGEVTFSSRFFPVGNVTVRLSRDSFVNEMSVTSMNRIVPVP